HWTGWPQRDLTRRQVPRGRAERSWQRADRARPDTLLVARHRGHDAPGDVRGRRRAGPVARSRSIPRARIAPALGALSLARCRVYDVPRLPMGCAARRNRLDHRVLRAVEAMGARPLRGATSFARPAYVAAVPALQADVPLGRREARERGSALARS